jgi:hypothetical protein
MSAADDEYWEATEDLLGLYGTLRGRTISESHRRVIQVAHGWYLRCHRGVEAISILDDNGHSEEAAPIRRSVIEHVIGLKWLAKEGNAAQAPIRRGASHGAENLLAAVHAANWTSVDLSTFPEVIADKDALDPGSDHLLRFKHRCEKYGIPGDWTQYLAETGRSHACWESASPYIAEAPDGSAELRDEPKIHTEQGGFCAIHMLQALVAVDSMFVGAPLESDLERIAKRSFRITKRVRQSQGLPIPDEWQDL